VCDVARDSDTPSGAAAVAIDGSGADVQFMDPQACSWPAICTVAQRVARATPHSFPQQERSSIMANVKLTIVYYSSYGTNHNMAEVAAEAAEQAGAEVRLRRAAETAPDEVVEAQEAWSAQLERNSHIEEVTTDDMVWADAYLFSAPTRYGGAASQLRAFIDTLGPIWQEGKLANKTFSAMTSASNPHGGQETTLQTLYITAMHWGAILVPPGYTDPAIAGAGGNPYGTSVTADNKPLSAEVRAAIRHQAERLVEVTARLNGEDESSEGWRSPATGAGASR
jgi:NAD(P)H dehydrogenase (quinone)